MEVFQESYGGPHQSPIDFFPGTMEVTDWIKEKPDPDMLEADPDAAFEQVVDRAALFGAARDQYYKVSGEKNLRALREPPRVCVNYNYGTDTSPYVEYWFLFKEENNGTTYKIFHKER